MRIRQLLPMLAALLGVGSLPLTAAEAAPKTDAWGVENPAWVTEASLTVKESYDSNIFGVSANAVGHTPVANQSAWVASASPRLMVDALKLGDFGAELKTLSLGYLGEYSLYAGHGSENNAKHTLLAQVKAVSGAWTLSADNSLLYVDGSRRDTYFSTASAYSSAFPRERRNQIQEKPSVSARFDTEEAFLRAVGSAAYFNLLTDHVNPVGADKGYVNYVNRSDANVGLDLGYKLDKDCAYLVGWRVGQQIQARYPWGGTHSDSSYNRLLLGFEGKLFPWLKGSAMVGPDYRRFTDAPNSGVAGARHTFTYAEASLAATLSKQDSLVSTVKSWHWVSSTGSAAYQESTYTVAWKHAFDSHLSTSVGAGFYASRYDYPALRNDQVWAFPVAVTYVFSKEVSVSADYLEQSSSSRLPDSVGTGRGFERHVLTLSVRLAL